MFADVLDTPIAKLTVSDNVNACKNLFNAGTLTSVSKSASDWGWKAHLVFLKTVLKDVLNYEATSFTQSNLVPHTLQSFVDKLHDLGW